MIQLNCLIDFQLQKLISYIPSKGTLLKKKPQKTIFNIRFKQQSDEDKIQMKFNVFYNKFTAKVTKKGGIKTYNKQHKGV